MEKTAFDARYFDARYQEYLAAIEDYLNGLFAEKPHWADLYEAMRYSVLSGGKRLRPVMTLEFARLCGSGLAQGRAGWPARWSWSTRIL